jgi:hypothetical protein
MSKQPFINGPDLAMCFCMLVAFLAMLAFFLSGYYGAALSVVILTCQLWFLAEILRLLRDIRDDLRCKNDGQWPGQEE